MAKFEFAAPARVPRLVPRWFLRLAASAQADSDACAEVARREPVRPERIVQAQAFAAYWWFALTLWLVILGLASLLMAGGVSDPAVRAKAADTTLVLFVVLFLYAVTTYGVVVTRATQLRDDFRARAGSSGPRQAFPARGLPKSYDAWLGLVPSLPPLFLGFILLYG